MITLHLEKLHFFAHHGMYDEEKKLGNDFELNITLSFIPENDIIRHFDETINYAAVYELAKAEMLQPRELLETFVTQLAEKIKQQFPQVVQVAISLYKLSMPLTNFEGKVGVALQRNFDA